MKKTTNYDRIKSMSVEEMAEFLSNTTPNLGIKLNDVYVICGIGYIKQWLLREVSEDITKIEHNSLCETETYERR